MPRLAGFGEDGRAGMAASIVICASPKSRKTYRYAPSHRKLWHAIGLPVERTFGSRGTSDRRWRAEEWRGTRVSASSSVILSGRGKAALGAMCTDHIFEPCRASSLQGLESGNVTMEIPDEKEHLWIFSKWSRLRSPAGTVGGGTKYPSKRSHSHSRCSMMDARFGQRLSAPLFSFPASWTRNWPRIFKESGRDSKRKLAASTGK
jgi:hypothetical protein